MQERMKCTSTKHARPLSPGTLVLARKGRRRGVGARDGKETRVAQTPRHSLRQPRDAVGQGRRKCRAHLASSLSSSSLSSSSSSLPCSDGAGVEVREMVGEGGSDMGLGYRSWSLEDWNRLGDRGRGGRAGQVSGGDETIVLDSVARWSVATAPGHWENAATLGFDVATMLAWAELSEYRNEHCQFRLLALLWIQLWRKSLVARQGAFSGWVTRSNAGINNRKHCRKLICFAHNRHFVVFCTVGSSSTSCQSKNLGYHS